MPAPLAPPAWLLAALSESLSDHPDQPVAVAYSGGVDSELLAATLAAWQHTHPDIPCRLIHVHHGLSAHADDWVAHCRARAQGYGLPFLCLQVTPEQGARISLEASARDARYQALAEALQPGELLLTGQHQDDQAETLLLALKRGSGPKGLSAMAAAMSFARGTLLRPWLGLSRAGLEAAAAIMNLEHIEDGSNADTRFDRNFLRRNVLPELNARWPGFSANVARSAALCAEQQALCDELAEADLTARLGDDGSLAMSGIECLSDARRNNLLRFWLRGQGALMPSQVQMQAMAALWTAREDAQPRLDWAGHSLRRFQGRLYLVTETGPLPGEERLPSGQGFTLANGEAWQLETVNDGARLRLPEPGQQLVVRYGLPGSTVLKPAGRAGSRALKKLWQEQGVPPWRRGQVALLCYDDHIVAALGHWLEASALAADGPGWRPQRVVARLPSRD